MWYNNIMTTQLSIFDRPLQKGDRVRHRESLHQATVTSDPFPGAGKYVGSMVVEVEYASGMLRPTVPVQDLELLAEQV